LLCVEHGFGLAAASGPAAAQDEDVFANPEVCDADGNGNLSETEASDCAARGWATWTEEEVMTEEQFGEAWGRENSREVFAEVDADGDGNLTSDEWRAWHEEQFASRSEASGGEMSTEDFGAWYRSTDPND
jgi:Ca2+-binding EF-hand superfamily protein